MLVLRNGLIVNGDGRTPPFLGSVLVDGGLVAAVTPGDLHGGRADVSVDVGGRLIVPGAINPHAHAAAPGPRFASGTPGVSRAEVFGNLRRHLVQGHTTVVDLDGFKVAEELAQVQGTQPVRVEASTIHFAPMFAAADACDGAGLSEHHRGVTARQRCDGGAVVIGEVGAGMTLGGGGQDYIYIPEAIAEAIGIRPSQSQSQQLKYAVLGRHVRPGNADREKAAALLKEYGLGQLSVDRLVALIEESVLPSFESALEGVEVSAKLAIELGVPTLVHNSAPSDDASRVAAEIAGELFIGGHTNHPTYTPEESVANARWIRDHGGHIEVDTFDFWGGGTGVRRTPDHLIALAQQDLIDIIATDYAAGHWDGMWQLVSAFAQMGLASIEKAVAMATGNVARALPRVGANRGSLRAGNVADIVVASPHSPADIQIVVIDGQLAYRNPTSSVDVSDLQSLD